MWRGIYARFKSHGENRARNRSERIDNAPFGEKPSPRVESVQEIRYPRTAGNEARGGERDGERLRFLVMRTVGRQAVCRDTGILPHYFDRRDIGILPHYFDPTTSTPLPPPSSSGKRSGGTGVDAVARGGIRPVARFSHRVVLLPSRHCLWTKRSIYIYI